MNLQRSRKLQYLDKASSSTLSKKGRNGHTETQSTIFNLAKGGRNGHTETHITPSSTLSKTGRDRHTESIIFNLVKEGKGWTHREHHLQPCQRGEGMDTQIASSSTLSKGGRDRHTESVIFNLVKEWKRWTHRAPSFFNLVKEGK